MSLRDMTDTLDRLATTEEANEFIARHRLPLEVEKCCKEFMLDGQGTLKCLISWHLPLFIQQESIVILLLLCCTFRMLLGLCG